MAYMKDTIDLEEIEITNIGKDIMIEGYAKQGSD